MKIEHLKLATTLIEGRADLIESVRHTRDIFKRLKILRDEKLNGESGKISGLEFAVEIGNVRLQADWLDGAFQGKFHKVVGCSISSALKILEVILDDFLVQIKDIESHLSTLGVGSYDENYDYLKDYDYVKDGIEDEKHPDTSI